MVKILKRTVLEDGTFYVEAAGLSTDSKPTHNISTGSLFHEVDSTKVYAYEESGGEWVEQIQLGGDA